MRSLIDIITEKLAGPALLDGFWIDASGEMLECDHRHDWHHADIVSFEFKTDEDTAENNAFQAGWVRGCWYDKVLTVEWATRPSEAARKTLLRWLTSYAAAFRSIYVDGPGGEANFTDTRAAINNVKAQL